MQKQSDQNLVEKIAQQFAVGLAPDHTVKSGDYLSVRPAHVMTHDNTGAVMKKFRSCGATRMASPGQPVFILDHNIQDKSETNLKKYAGIESFAREMGVDFYPAGRGIGHQVLCEEGYVWPGTLVVASDSHSNMYGALGCLGTPIVRTDAASIWATGRTWWRTPPVARVVLRGVLPVGVTGKDVIITLCAFFNQDEVLNHAVEFTGEGVATLNMEQRFTIANMTTEWGALAGVFPIDTVTLDWLAERCKFIEKRGPAAVPSAGAAGRARFSEERLAALKADILQADAGATYAIEMTLDLGTVRPQVAGPNHVKTMASAAKLAGQKLKVDRAYLVSCVNSRLEDLAEAARVMRGKQVASAVKFYVAAASSEVQSASESAGDWDALLSAGAIALPPGCGPCIGLGAGLLEDGERGISATNRNFKGRMGSAQAEAYLASPAVVAASALAGFIDTPYDLADCEPEARVVNRARATGSAAPVELLEGFPETIAGALLFCFQDNLNTDGIFPGKYTYQDDFTAEQQAKVVMENYDPQFGSLLRKGDILAGGYNFGTGSSREQAATAFKYAGVRLALAGSFSETYKRNALNNGFLILEAPEFIDLLKSRYGTGALTVRVEAMVELNFRHSYLIFEGERYPISSVGAAAQELILAGGLESWIRKHI